MAASFLWFAIKTIHWPLTGDASLMRYVGFLMDHGWVPYRDIGDINLPGSYVPDWLVVHFLGTAALPWRLYDLGLLTVIFAGMHLVPRRGVVFVTIWGGCLFALIHGRDGLQQVGQRDLTAAALLLSGVVCLFRGIRSARSWPTIAFGFYVGLATMMKPTFALFLLLILPDIWSNHKIARRAIHRIVMAIIGWLLPVVGCLTWLAANDGLRAFWFSMYVLAPYHASLGHTTWGFLLYNSISPILPIIAVWLVVLMLKPLYSSSCPDSPISILERRILLFAATLGFTSYLLQRKGFLYHRYPFLVFLLIVIALDLNTILETSHRVRWLSAVALLWASLVLAPASAMKASHYDWQHQEVQSLMESDLRRVADRVHGGSLSGRVQCLDTISGCISTLNDMQIEQSSGLLYDEFVLHPAGPRAINDTRARFWRAMQNNPPLVFIVSDPLFPSGPDHYAKMTQWPDFLDWLNRNYRLEAERQPSIPVRGVGRFTVPFGYRLYVYRKQ
jgi:hypothetical protein